MPVTARAHVHVFLSNENQRLARPVDCGRVRSVGDVTRGITGVRQNRVHVCASRRVPDECDKREIDGRGAVVDAGEDKPRVFLGQIRGDAGAVGCGDGEQPV